MISVIIPAYNAQAYLRECLESVLAQSFSDWEAIVIDDGSTDGTASIAQSFQRRDSRIRVVSTPNRGVSAARNTALDNARGEWVTFLDSDDMLPPATLEAYMRYAGCGADIIAGQWVRADAQVSTLSSDTSSRRYSASDALTGGLYQTGVSTMVGAKAYSRPVIDKVRFQEDIRYEDLVFFCEAMLAASDVVEIGDTTYIYRDNPHSFINTFSPVRLDVLRATVRIERLCSYDSALLAAARDRRLSAAYNIYGLLSVHDSDGLYADAKNESWEIIRKYRAASLRNPRVRLKNRVGVLVSYLGKGMLTLMSGIVYRR